MRWASRRQHDDWRLRGGQGTAALGAREFFGRQAGLVGLTFGRLQAQHIVVQPSRGRCQQALQLLARLLAGCALPRMRRRRGAVGFAPRCSGALGVLAPLALMPARQGLVGLLPLAGELLGAFLWKHLARAVAARAGAVGIGGAARGRVGAAHYLRGGWLAGEAQRQR